MVSQGDVVVMNSWQGSAWADKLPFLQDFSHMNSLVEGEEIMIIPLLVDVTAFVLVLGQIVLDYKWTDRRTNKQRRLRIALPWVLLLLLLLSGWKTFKQEHDNGLLQTQLAGLNSKLVEVQQLLSPFTNLASQAYPGQDIQTALNKLATDVDKLKRSTAPRHVTDMQRAQIVEILRPLGRITIKVQRRGELEAYNYANELIDVFRLTGLVVEVDGGLGSLSPPEYGITWWARDEMSPVAQALSAVMKTLGIRNRGHFVRNLENEGAIRVGLKSPE
jgi:hypothetical protein